MSLGSLGDLLITLRADIGTLRSDMGKAAQIAAAGGRRIEAALAGAANGFKTLAAGATAVKLASFVRQSYAAGSELQNLADKAGASGGALSELKGAAELADVPFASLSSSLLKLNQRLGDAKNSKEAARAFTSLGLSVETLRGLKADEAFSAVADKIAGLRDEEARAAAANDVFGKSYTDILPLLNRGAGGIQRLREEYKLLGGALSDEDVQRLADTDNALKALKLSADAAASSIGAKLAPALTYFFNQLAFGGGDALDGLNNKILGAQQRVRDLQGFLANPNVRDQGTIGELFKAQLELAQLKAQQRKLLGLGREGAQKADPFEVIVTATRVTKKEIAEAKAAAEAFQAVLDGLNKDINQSANQLAASVTGDSILSADELYAIVNAERDAAEAARETRDALVSAAKDAIDPTREITRRYAELREAILATIATLPEGSARVVELQRTLGELAKKEAEDIRATGNELTVFADQAARNMQDAFAEFLFDPFKGGLRGMLTGFLTTLRRMAAEAAAASIFKSLFGGNKGGGLGSAIGSFFGSFFGGGKANGGPVQGGTSYLVGERGPEMLTMGRGQSGSITPNNQLGGGGVVMNVTQNISGLGLPAEQVFQVVARANKQLARDLGAANRRAGLPEPRW